MCIFDAKWLHLWQVACCSEVYIRLPSLTVQASLKSGEEAAYTEEANAQLPVEDDSTVLGIVDRAAESDAEDAGTSFGGMTVPQREITVQERHILQRNRKMMPRIS